MENLYLDNPNNALQNYLGNNSYRDKIMIGYYAYSLDFCNSEIALCTMFCVVYNSIQKFTIITVIKLLSLSR